MGAYALADDWSLLPAEQALRDGRRQQRSACPLDLQIECVRVALHTCGRPQTPERVMSPKLE